MITAFFCISPRPARIWTKLYVCFHFPWVHLHKDCVCCQLKKGNKSPNWHGRSSKCWPNNTTWCDEQECSDWNAGQRIYIFFCIRHGSSKRWLSVKASSVITVMIRPCWGGGLRPTTTMTTTHMTFWAITATLGQKISSPSPKFHNLDAAQTCDKEKHSPQSLGESNRQLTEIKDQNKSKKLPC